MGATERLGDEEALARTHLVIANGYGKLGDLDASVAHLHQAFARYRLLGDVIGEAHALSGLGWAFDRLDRHTEGSSTRRGATNSTWLLGIWTGREGR